ncbi:MAG: phosphatase PAP2 family protein [Alphaproteobacteria bacterium]|nr:phosphatase PAP2 family protein [Alphaproteobacteria bacterium]
MLKFLNICSVLLAFMAMPAIANEDIDSLRYPDAEWGDNLLSALEAGPSILGEEEIFVVELPPTNSSQVTKDEIAYLHEIAKAERTPDNVDRIYYENSGAQAYEFFVKEGLISADNYKTIELLKMIDVDHVYFLLERKKYFSRPRPNHIDETLETVIDNPKHPAYPSGHASQTYIVALVLSEFDPKNAAIYKQFAVDVAHRREIAGVHYPSDSVAGRKMAVDVLERLRSVSVFEKKFQDAKSTFVVSYNLPDDEEVEEAE